MQTRIALLMFVSLMALDCVTAQHIPRSNLQVHISFSMNAETTYVYIVRNDSSSAQSMETLRLEIGDVDSSQGGTMRGFQVPSHWTGWVDNAVAQPRDFTAKAIVIWGIADTIASIDDMYTLPVHAVQPNAMITLSFKSRGLPSIKRFFARGWAPPLTEQVYDSLRQLGQSHGDIVKPWFVDAYIGKTIAPRIAPDPFVALAFLDTLIAMKNEAKTLLWVKGAVYTEVTDHYANARGFIESSDLESAKTELDKVITLVTGECQSLGPTSDLTTEGCALLLYNTQYLRDHLE